MEFLKDTLEKHPAFEQALVGGILPQGAACTGGDVCQTGLYCCTEKLSANVNFNICDVKTSSTCTTVAYCPAAEPSCNVSPAQMQYMMMAAGAAFCCCLAAMCFCFRVYQRNLAKQREEGKA